MGVEKQFFEGEVTKKLGDGVAKYFWACGKNFGCGQIFFREMRDDESPK